MTTLSFVLMALLAISLIFNFICYFKKVSKPGGTGPGQGPIPFTGLIPLKYALTLISNYRNRRELHTQLLPNHRKQNGDAHSVFVSLDNIKGYIQHIEQRANSKNININGIRIFFAAYDHNDARANKNVPGEDKRGFQTIVIFPTIGDDYMAIDIESSTKEKPNFIQKLIEFNGDDQIKLKSDDEGQKQLKQQNQTILFNAVGDDDSSGYNDMHSSPPRQ